VTKIELSLTSLEAKTVKQALERLLVALGMDNMEALASDTDQPYQVAPEVMETQQQLVGSLVERFDTIIRIIDLLNELAYKQDALANYHTPEQSKYRQPDL
jgi:hypothetical protein